MIKRHQILLTLMIWATVSCSLSETGPGIRQPGGDIWRNPAFNADSVNAEKKICYVTGLDYPEGYNWMADPEKGTVKCSLVVFAEGRPVMKLPVGKEYHVSPDPDMHRIIEGHIYTDYSTETETIIKKDGQELFRYPGREMILGMTIMESDVYTLGKPRSGEGFTYRKNGEPVVERSIGYAFPRLQHEGDTLFFAFSEPIEAVGTSHERYYHVRNGRISQVAVREDVTKVWDIIRHNGKTCYLASLTGIPSPVAVDGTRMKALEYSQGMNMLASRLFSAGEYLGVEGICTSGSAYSSSLWKDGVRYRQFPGNMVTNGICTSQDGICCMLNPAKAGGNGIIFRCGESLTMPSGYASMGNSPIDMMDGILYAGLSSLKGNRPILWKDGKTTELDINGMICTLTVD